MKRKVLVGILIFVLGVITVLGYSLYKKQKYAKEDAPAAVDLSTFVHEQKADVISSSDVVAFQNSSSQESSVQTMESEQTEPVTPSPIAPPVTVPGQDSKDMPVELNFAMTFYPQAPFGNWDYPWQEACEEASVLLVANVYEKKNWSAEQFNNEILKMVEWEKKEFGDYKHTTIAQTATILNDYLGLKIIIHENPTFEDVQKVLNKGHLIVMTFAGKKLYNPNYRNGGPNYHAMVIKGYKAGNKIVTEDVGTRRGEDYVYSWTVLQNALHDYAEPIEAGGKRMIEVIPPANF